MLQATNSRTVPVRFGSDGEEGVTALKSPALDPVTTYNEQPVSEEISLPHLMPTSPKQFNSTDIHPKLNISHLHHVPVRGDLGQALGHLGTPGPQQEGHAGVRVSVERVEVRVNPHSWVALQQIMST